MPHALCDRRDHPERFSRAVRRPRRQGVEAGGFVIRARRFGHRYRCRNSFTHAANYHASLVLRQILFRLPTPENRDIIPRATFTDPEIAAVGLGEGRAIARPIRP
jgi:hypothetical protein